MRQCPGCSYFVPEGWSACKRCGSALPAETPPLAVPAGVGAPGAGAPPVPSGLPRPSPPAPPAPGSGHGPGFTGRAPGTDPRFATPARLAPAGPPARPVVTARGTNRVWIVLPVVLALLAAAGWFAWSRFGGAETVPEALRSYAAGDTGVDYTGGAGTFTATFPATPIETTQTFSMNGVSVAMSVAADAGAEYAVIVAVVALPAGEMPADLTAGLDSAVEMASAAVEGQVTRTEHTTHMGRPAVDMFLEVPEGEMQARLVLGEGRLHMAAVGSVGGVGEPFERLVESWHVNA